MPAVALCLALVMLATPSPLHAQVDNRWRGREGRGDVASSASSTASPTLATVAAIALSIRSRAIQDSRCYLINGGAVESFFISEDTPVGSVIGTLSVNGDPSEEQGDITLRLQEKNAAVGIAAGTKNLTLLRALDREERSGPSNVYVNSFIIPVSVRVWDVNDNAPVWSGAPYRARLSELSAVGTRVLPALRATDADQPGPHATIHYSVLPGPDSEYFGFVNELDSVLVVRKPLDYESQRNVSVTLRAADRGAPPRHADARLSVEVLDADDQNPRFSHDHYTAVVPDDATQGMVLETSPGPISAVDQDVGINAPLFYTTTGDNKHLVAIHRDTGQVTLTEELLESLQQPVTIVIKATQVDNPDRYALATLTARTARRAARRGVRFVRAQHGAAVSETAAPGAVLATLHTDPPAGRHSNPLQFYVSDRSFLEKFAINSAGEVLLRRPLDFETADSYFYQVMVTDGAGTNDTASINITVLDVNEWEPRFKYPQYEFRVERADGEGGAGGEGGEGGEGSPALLLAGQLDVFDGDRLDNVTLTLRGPDAGMLYLDASGALYVRAAPGALHAAALHALATATDSGTPPRQTSVPVTVHVGAALLQARGASGASVALLLAAALALLLCVCVLLAYVYRVKRSRSKQSPGPPSVKPSEFVSHEKSPAPAAPAPAPAPAAPAPVLCGGSSGSLLSVSAGASTILANSSSSLDLRHEPAPGSGGRQSQRFPRSKIAPRPPPAPSVTVAGGAALMSDHLVGGGGRSGVAWPSATIPARVKKLSWDDAAPPAAPRAAHQDSGEENQEIHDATNPTVADHMNLTVYF